MIFMYAVSFGMLGAQYMMGDVFNITLTNFEGTEIRSNVLNIIDVDQINESTLNVVNTNQTTVLTDPIVGAASIAWEIFLLLTGTYVFNILYLLGVPLIFVSGMILIYLVMLARAIIAYLRGI